MKKKLTIFIMAIAVLFILGLAGYRLWFYHPYPDILLLDASSVFQGQQAAEGLLIRNTTLIDVKPPELFPMGTCSSGAIPSLKSPLEEPLK